MICACVFLSHVNVQGIAIGSVVIVVGKKIARFGDLGHLSDQEEY